MTTYYPRQSNGLGQVLLFLIVAALLVVAVLWFIGHRGHETSGGDLLPARTAATSESASSDLAKAGSAASSAVSKASAAASVALSETSADIKAAVNKQKQQEAAESRASR